MVYINAGVLLVMRIVYVSNTEYIYKYDTKYDTGHLPGAFCDGSCFDCN